MHQLILTATAELAAFLAHHLPALDETWWDRYVIRSLTFTQQRIISEQGHTTLQQLDFAALLRVFYQNWFELSKPLNLPNEGRYWVRELQSVRNRWAHLSASTVPAVDIYRDADTLVRVFDLIDASAKAVAEAEAFKTEMLYKIATSATDPTLNFNSTTSNTTEKKDTLNNTELTNSEFEVTTPQFKVGEIVGLSSDTTTTVPVIKVITSDAETRYKVFQDNHPATYYESQLRRIDTTDESAVICAEDLRAHLTSLHLLSPSMTNLFSLRSGRVSFIPYQYRPVLRLIRADRPRLLIADEVGVGKTIEAGLIIKELRARTDISSVLIICPKALVAERKWFTEMKRFDENFKTLDGPTLRHCMSETKADGKWPDEYSKVIVPFSLFDSKLLFGKERKGRRTNEGLLALDPPPKFDLVIVDEAHHIRNAQTFLHQAVRYFCDHAEAAVFLTATPVQLGSEDLFSLLNVLRPDLVIDQPSFKQMAEPNKFINAAVSICRRAEESWQKRAHGSISEAAQTEWGSLFIRESPAFQEIYDKLATEQIDDSDRIRIIRSLEEFYTFSPMINRTRRRDIGEFTTRNPETQNIEFTSTQRSLHDDLLEVVKRILEFTHGDQNVKFMMSTIRRQAASCLYGLVPLLRNILDRKLNNLETIDVDELDEEPRLSVALISDIQRDIESLLERAERLDTNDPKIRRFIKVLKDKSLMNNNKSLVFSTFRHTLAYIEQHVAEVEFRYGLVHGGISDDERFELRRRFALPKDDIEALDVLLSSEVGGEGLDFQFCDLLINYDLPWNPMRIEQRIGRIDRYGQKSENIAIVNLITPGTVDADIYNRCLKRIGVFNQTVGGSEEILGEITSEIRNIADNYTLSPQQRAEQLQQLSDNKILKVQEEITLEQQQAELFGLTIPNQSWRDEILEAESFWLSPDALKRCTIMYLKAVAATGGNFRFDEKPIKTLRLSQEIRARLLKDLCRLGRSPDPVIRQWEIWLKGTESRLQVTFDQETAVAQPKVVYLDVLHPLIRQSAEFGQLLEPVHVNLVVSTDLVNPGVYSFAVYYWHKVGIRPDDSFVAISSNPNLNGTILTLLQKATDAPDELEFSVNEIDQLESQHHSKWQSARANHIQENREFVQLRLNSLNTSHTARCKLLQEQINGATNEKISRMKKAELTRANKDFQQRTDNLKSLAESADINTKLVVSGVIRISGVNKK